jgi:hypothetical protein
VLADLDVGWVECWVAVGLAKGVWHHHARAELVDCIVR